MLFRLLILTVLLTPKLCLAGAWLQPVDRGLVVTSITHYQTDTYFDADGTEQAQPRYSKWEFQPYVEYGVRHWLTVGGSASVQRVSQSGGSNQGIADPELFARLRLWEGDGRILSIEPRVKLPSQFGSDANPRGGSRSHDQEIALLYGQSYPILSARDYLDVRMAYRTRNRALADQWRVDMAAGIHLNDTWTLLPALRSTMPIQAKDSAIYSENGDLDYSLVKAELGVGYALSDIRQLQATLFQHVAGTQTGNGFGVMLGLAQEF
jgi:hypothetical protein